MRSCASVLLLLTVIFGCSKKNTARVNFAELTVGDHKFVFNHLEAIFDTSTDVFACNVRLDDTVSNSSMNWETLAGTKWINGDYGYPGQQIPGRSIVFMHVQTYIDHFPGTYNLQNNYFTLTIDQSENGRMHGTFSGKMTCLTCVPYGEEVGITNGEFEMPYSYR